MLKYDTETEGINQTEKPDYSGKSEPVDNAKKAQLKQLHSAPHFLRCRKIHAPAIIPSMIMMTISTVRRSSYTA